MTTTTPSRAAVLHLESLVRLAVADDRLSDCEADALAAAGER
jgi:hypothetical protein